MGFSLGGRGIIRLGMFEAWDLGWGLGFGYTISITSLESIIIPIAKTPSLWGGAIGV